MRRGVGDVSSGSMCGGAIKSENRLRSEAALTKAMTVERTPTEFVPPEPRL